MDTVCRLSSLQQRIVSAFVMIPLAVFVMLADSWVFRAVLLILLALSLREWMRVSLGGPRPAFDLVSGALYISLCFAAFILIHDFILDGPWLTLALVMSVAASDIGAYVTGRLIGGPKLAPKISPNKTWAGFGGAMGFCALTLTLFYAMENVVLSAPLLVPGGAATVFVAGLALGIAGQAGDLLISSYKRRCGMKDSGALIPGHGGLLDRIDSHLLAAPVFFALLEMTGD